MSKLCLDYQESCVGMASFKRLRSGNLYRINGSLLAAVRSCAAVCMNSRARKLLAANFALTCDGPQAQQDGVGPGHGFLQLSRRYDYFGRGPVGLDR